MPEVAAPEETRRSPGRPSGRRAIAARHSVRLDEARQEALINLSERHSRSVHSLIIEAIDALIRRGGAVGFS